MRARVRRCGTTVIEFRDGNLLEFLDSIYGVDCQIHDRDFNAEPARDGRVRLSMLD